MCKVYLLHRLSNQLYRMGIPVLPRVIYYFMRFAFTTSVPWTVTVGRGTRFNNWGMGIVVHRRVVIGEKCSIGQGVTIGGRSGHFEVPVLGNNVVVGVGAKVLGPIKVGDHAVIGANAVVINDVPPYAVVAGVPARIVKNRSEIGKTMATVG
jgi:serine O-acetyltransferase